MIEVIRAYCEHHNYPGKNYTKVLVSDPVTVGQGYVFKGGNGEWIVSGLVAGNEHYSPERKTLIMIIKQR